jgi:molybdenum cofactor cytidylyltransferase
MLAAMVPGIILAAGASSRMGRPKALLPLGPDGETFVSHLVQVLREGGVDDVLVVIGLQAQQPIGRVLQGLRPIRIVINEAPHGGQLTSILAGLDVADRPGVHGVLVMPVDQPLVLPATVRALIDAYRTTRPPIVRPQRAGRGGHPVIFDRVVFGALRRADPAEGARQVVHAFEPAALNLPVDDEGAFADVDTPADYERLIGPFPAT